MTYFFREMVKESSQNFGYLVWLDFRRVENTDYDVFARPAILPYIPEGTMETDDPRCKKLCEAARNIASVASRIISEVDSKTMSKVNDPRKTIAEVTGGYKRKMVHNKEYLWYKARDCWQGVIDISK
jgi:hypothetical protein